MRATIAAVAPLHSRQHTSHDNAPARPAPARAPRNNRVRYCKWTEPRLQSRIRLYWVSCVDGRFETPRAIPLIFGRPHETCLQHVQTEYRPDPFGLSISTVRAACCRPTLLYRRLAVERRAPSSVRRSRTRAAIRTKLRRRRHRFARSTYSKF